MKRLRHILTARIVPIANTLRFAVGKDRLGRWIALELHGRGGGFFRSREDAVHYAMAECGGRRSAVRFARRPLAPPF